MPLKHVPIGTCAFAKANVHMRGATFEFVHCACINRTVYSYVNKAVRECVIGIAACAYAQHRLMCVDVIRHIRMYC